MQRIEADTEIQLPEKEPSRYFLSDNFEEDSRYSFEDLELSKIISSKDKNGEVENVSKYLTDIANDLNMKDEDTNETYCEDSLKRLKELKITVSSVK